MATGFGRTTDPPPEGGSPQGRVPVLALAGRPNVGKSSLFNRLAGQDLAVVEARAGVTRDPLVARAEWAGQAFRVVDTGGLGAPVQDPLGSEVAARAEAVLQTADCILFVVDAAAGLHPEDRRIADWLRRLGRPVMVLANKCDRRGAAAEEFYALGFGPPLPVSATQGEGVGDALDAVLAVAHGGVTSASLPPPAKVPGRWVPAAGAGEEVDAIPVAIVGRPNAGKSSLVNRLLGAPRMLVSEVPGTTRDAVDIPWRASGREFLLVDTPGLRRRSHIEPGELEHASARRSLQAMQRADVVALVIDADQGCTDQDRRIATWAWERGRAVVLVLNKWDTVPPSRAAPVEQQLRKMLPLLQDVPVVRCSARTGSGVADLVPALVASAEAHRLRLPTAALNRCLRDALAVRPAPVHGTSGRPLRIYYAAQVRTRPPTIVLFSNQDGRAVPLDYIRYLERQLRAAFTLRGTPLRLVFRPRSRRPLAARRQGRGMAETRQA